MKTKKMKFKILILTLFLSLIITQIFPSTALKTNEKSHSRIYTPNELSAQNNVNLDNITSAMQLNVYNQTATIEGYNLVQTMRNYVIPGDPCIYSRVAYGLCIFDMEGNIVKYSDNYRALLGKAYNSTTFFTDGSTYTSNITLWNLETYVEEVLPIDRGSHDVVYNPYTKTFLTLNDVYSDEVWDGLPVLYQHIREYNMNGELLWEWNSTARLPFDSLVHTSLGFNDTFKNGADWMHVTSLVWNYEDNTILAMVRNHDTIYKIDKDTKEILWTAGRLGTFDLYDINGEETDYIWWHPHGMEQIGSNKYIIFDNDARNITNPDSLILLNGYSRYLEFIIDEESEAIHLTWSYVGPDATYFLPRSGGDCDRLPNGNTVGIFGSKGKATTVYNDTHPVYYTEVDRDGNIVWQIEMTNTSEYAFQSYNFERFYDSPLIEFDKDSFSAPKNQNATIKLKTWNSIRLHYPSAGTVSILEDDNVLLSQEFEFLPHWQATELELNITGLKKGSHDLQLIIENSDGIITVVDIILDITHADGFTIAMTIIPLCSVAVIVYVYKKRRISK